MEFEYKRIDVDSHCQEKPDTWTSRMSKAKWGDRIPQIRGKGRQGVLGLRRPRDDERMVVLVPRRHPRSDDPAHPLAGRAVDGLYRRRADAGDGQGWRIGAGAVSKRGGRQRRGFHEKGTRIRAGLRAGLQRLPGRRVLRRRARRFITLAQLPLSSGGGGGCRAEACGPARPSRIHHDRRHRAVSAAGLCRPLLGSIVGDGPGNRHPGALPQHRRRQQAAISARSRARATPRCSLSAAPIPSPCLRRSSPTSCSAECWSGSPN